MNDDELRELVKVAFDVATHSLDFGSGWLDDAEVRSLRELAVWLGVDPVVATPYNFRSKYGIPTLRNRRGPSPPIDPAAVAAQVRALIGNVPAVPVSPVRENEA